MLILDFGSGNTCHNDIDYIKGMYDELAAVTDRRDIVCKWQLFSYAPPNIPLDGGSFAFAHEYGTSLGFPVTASVFDKDCLDELADYEIPWVKVANRRDLGYLADYARNLGLEVIQSVPTGGDFALCYYCTPLCCVSEYPAMPTDYEKLFQPGQLKQGISDHTVGFSLYLKYRPKLWEKHYILEHDMDNPDAGYFAITPEDVAWLDGKGLI